VKEQPELFAAGAASVQPGQPQPPRADGALAKAPHRSRCWLEKHPERRVAVDRTRGGYAQFKVGTEIAPAELYHRTATRTGERPIEEVQREERGE
jgi:hypothetical protein